jgi:hypothetical protein
MVGERTNAPGSRVLPGVAPGRRLGIALADHARVASRSSFTILGTAHLSPRARRAVKLAVAALVGIPWIPLAAALYAWVH